MGENGKLSYVIADEKEQKEEDLVRNNKRLNRTNQKLSKINDPNMKHNLNPRYTTLKILLKVREISLQELLLVQLAIILVEHLLILFLFTVVLVWVKHILFNLLEIALLEKFPDKKVIYLSSDSFTVEFVEAIQSNKVNVFF